MLTATSASQPKPLHPMQIMASLVFHYQRLLRLDDPSIATKEQAAAALGMKSAGGARFPLEASQRLGTDGLREAVGLLAQAELDLRGAERARRADRDRRARRAPGRAQPPALRGRAVPTRRGDRRAGLSLRRSPRRGRASSGATCGGRPVLVDDALGDAALSMRFCAACTVLGRRRRRRSATAVSATFTRVFSSERTALLRIAARLVLPVALLLRLDVGHENLFWRTCLERTGRGYQERFGIPPPAREPRE